MTDSLAATKAVPGSKTQVSDATVVGAGPAGLSAALALAKLGVRTICAGPPFNADPTRPDTRTTALLVGSVALLRNIGVWKKCRQFSAPLKSIRIIDDTGWILAAPEVMFHAAELGLDAFGHNVPNAALVAAMAETIEQNENVELLATQGITKIDAETDRCLLSLSEGGEISARLVVGADGRQSICRQAAGIGTRKWSYDQAAIACNFDHVGDHDFISNEFHHDAGPFTTVPLPGRSSSLVWVVRPAEAKRLMALDDAAFIDEIERNLHGLLGRVNTVGKRASFPLSGLSAKSLAGRRTALIGEAAHVIPPIGAQGLNLGFRDAATLADCVAKTLSKGGDPGGPETVQTYSRIRHRDVANRTFAVDILNRSLLSDFVPIRLARGFGLHLLKTVGPLRQFVMRQGLAPSADMPALMRTDGAAHQA